MRNVWLIVKREYVERVRTRAFLIFTLLTPALMFCFTVLPAKLIGMQSGGTQRIAVVASDETMGNAIRDGIFEEVKKAVKTTQVEVISDTSDTERAQLMAQVDAGKYDGFLWATREAIASGVVTYYARSTGDFLEASAVEKGVQDTVLRQRLATQGMSRPEVADLLKPVRLESAQIKNGRSSKPDDGTALFTGMFMLMLMYISVLIYGMNVMRSVLEEKTSRVLEVLLSSVTAKELMAGKILGVGAVGLTQIGIWALVSILYSVPAAIHARNSGELALNLSGYVLIAFGVYFLLGYLLYSAMCGALGATVNSEQEAQQVNFIVAMPLIFSLMIGFYVIRQPNSPAAVFFSMVPFCAPMLMVLRIALQSPPIWQVAVSITLMIATTYAMLILCSKIYRVGILMYGKRPNFREILKWLKYD